MVLPEFESLAQGLAELMGHPAPGLQPDEFGLVGFAVRLHEVNFSLVQSSERDSVAALHILAGFGGVPPEREAHVCATLMAANFTLLGLHAPSFSRNPATGEVFLRLSRPLREIEPAALRASLLAMAELVRGWREALSQPVLDKALARDHASDSAAAFA